MRRKIKVERKITPDFLFQSTKVGKMINYLMEEGKKNIATKILYQALATVREKTNSDPLEALETALNNVGPAMELKARRVGGANYQIPHEVNPARKQVLAMKWIIAASRGKKGKPMHLKLAEEIMLAAKKEGEAVKRRENVEKMAEANRAFAHFARVSRPPTPVVTN